MATIDQLQIEINANSRGAEKAVDELISKLHGLNNALNLNFGDNLTSSLHNLSDSLLSVRDSVNEIDVGRLKDVAGALRTLSTQGKNLAGLSAITKNVSKGLGNVSEKARETAKALATKFNIKGTNNLDEITAAVERFYKAADDPIAAKSALDYVKSLVEEYGLYERKISELNDEVSKAIRNADKRIPQGAYKEFADGQMKYMRGLLGINKTKNGEGFDMSDVANQINQQFGTRFNITNDMNAMFDMAEYLLKAHENAISVGEAVSQIPAYAEQVDKTFRDIADAAGIIVSNVREMQHIPLDLDDFDGETVSMMQQSGVAMQNIAQGASNAAPQVNNLSESMSKVNESGNIFEGIVSGLKSLQGMSQMPDFSSVRILADSISKLSGENVQRAAAALPQIGASISSLNGVTVPNLEGLDTLAQGLRSLGSKTVVNAANALPQLVGALREVETIHLGEGLGGITELSNAIRQFGYKSATAAIDNIPRIATAFNQMANTLSRAPAVSENTIRLAEAMGQLAQNGGRVFGGMNRASRGLNLFNNTAGRARKTTHSLASTIGKITATYWLLFRALGKVKQAIDLSSDLTEVQNVVDQTFRGESYKMNKFAEESIKNFGMAQLQAKEVGSRFQAMGSAMEIPNKAIQKSSEFLAKNSRMYGQNAKSMADMSIELTKLTADMGSFYNKDYAEVAEDMEAIFTGQTRPLRQYGLDLSQATLKEWAMNNGLNANIKTMSQAQKTMLRYQYVMAQTGAAQGDFARTSNTWANQIRMLKQNFEQLGVVVGKIFINAFKPAVKAMNAFIQKVTSFAEQIFNALGQIFGWEVEIDATGLADDFSDAASAADDLADGTGQAADNAKELNKQLAGFDRLNNLTTQKDSGGNGGSGSGSGAGSGGAGGKDDGYVQAKFKKIKSDIKDLETLGATIANTIANTLNDINWEEDVYPKVEKFGSGLADFMNGLFAGEAGEKLFESLGSTIAGAINSIFIAWDTWAEKIKWASIGTNIKKGVVKFLKKWKPKIAGSALANTASGIANALYNVVSDKKTWKLLGKKISQGINSFLKTMNKVNKDTGKNGWQAIGGSIASAFSGIGEAIKTALQDIDWGEALSGIWSGIKQFFTDLTPEGLLVLLGGLTTFSVFKTGIKSGILGALNPGGAGLPISIALACTFKELAGDQNDLKGNLIAAIAAGIAGAAVVRSPWGLTLTIPFAISAAIKWAGGDEDKNGKSNFHDLWDSIWNNVTLPGGAVTGFDGNQHTISVPISSRIQSLKWDMQKNRKNTLVMPEMEVDVTANITKTKDRLKAKDKVIDKITADITKSSMKKLPEKMRTIPGIVDFYQTKAKKLTEKMRTIPGVADFYKTKYDKLKPADVTIPGVAEFEKWKKAKDFNSQIDKLEAVFDKRSKGSKFDSSIPNMKAVLERKEKGTSFNSEIPNMKAVIERKEKGTNFNSDIPNMKAVITKKQTDSLDKNVNKMTANFTSKTVSRSVSNIDVTANVKQIKIPNNVKGIPGVYDFYAHKQALGGIFRNGAWKGLPQYASGGLPTHGSMFVAGEHGAEVVGHVGGQTEVLNQSQLASVMYAAVTSAMSAYVAEVHKSNEYLNVIARKDVSISSRDVFNATRSEATSYYNRTGRPAFEG